jgi:hypothetical protein
MFEVFSARLTRTPSIALGSINSEGNNIKRINWILKPLVNAKSGSIVTFYLKYSVLLLCFKCDVF